MAAMVIMGHGPVTNAQNKLVHLFFVFAVAAGCTPVQQEITPGAVLSVETGSADASGEIMMSVQAVLLQNPAYNEKMASHGLGSPTSYRFKFRGKCDSDADLQKAVGDIIRKTVKTPIKCKDIH